MYDKRSPKQQASLIYGYKLRAIKGLQGWASSSSRHSEIESFTQDELRQIGDICANAYHRAKEEYNEARRKIDTSTAETDSGIAEECRQYTGK